MNDKLFMLFGTGKDSVGLVGKITTPISKINGNIIDLRQDVIHGLFTIFLVLDLRQATVPQEQVQALIDQIAEDTGLDLSLDQYVSVPRSAEKKNLLLILLGKDRPGIISTVAEVLSAYNINIEFSDMIARENIFLMELMVDISHCVLPLENLQNTLRAKMAELEIRALFQSEDVFNKKKRVLLFDIVSSFIPPSVLAEILLQTGMTLEDVATDYGRSDRAAALAKAAANLENLPAAVANQLAVSLEATAGTIELIQTLKIMGYKIALMSRGFNFFTDVIGPKLGIDYCFGVPLPLNDDSMRIIGDIGGEELATFDREHIIERLMNQEAVTRDDITVISDEENSEHELPLGISLDVNIRIFLDFFNQHILSRQSLLGVIGSFGIPRV